MFSVAGKLIGRTSKWLLFAVIVAGVVLPNERDLLLIPSGFREIAGIAIAEPVPTPIIINIEDERYLIYPSDLNLEYAWERNNLVSSYDEERLRAEVAALERLIYHPPRDALLNYETLEVLDEVTGRALDAQATLDALEEVISRAAFDEIVTAQTTEIPAQVTSSDIGVYDPTPIGTYTTNFNKWEKNRNFNIKLCASFFDGIILPPGEDLSFNRTTGDRTWSTGYKAAPVIVNQELVPGVGGGSCQVSTTLYDAACLEAGLSVEERWPHGLRVHYVSWNRDATVSFPYRDLKFKNTYDSPILITSKVTENSITFSVYAHKGAMNRISEAELDATMRQTSKLPPPLKPKPKPVEEESEETEEAGQEGDAGAAELNPSEPPPEAVPDEDASADEAAPPPVEPPENDSPPPGNESAIEPPAGESED